MPTLSGSRTHQKASTSATQSGTPLMRPSGSRLRKRAMKIVSTMNQPLTGSRMRREEWVGCMLVSAGGDAALDSAFARLVVRIQVGRPRRRHLARRQHQHLAIALDAGQRFAQDAGEGVGGVA